MLSIAYALTSMVAGYTKVDDDLKAELDALKQRATTGRETALQLADEDAAASQAFGRAFHFEPGEEREDAIREASVTAAESSADLGRTGADAVRDLEWLAQHGNPALVADIAVACGALRAAVAGARTNMSFDLGSLTSSGESIEAVREQHPLLWHTEHQLSAVLSQIDQLSSEIERRTGPTPSPS
jgi:formiminotetrahydrofolate cyclodeaminase